MLIIFIIVSIILSLLIFLFKNKIITRVLSTLYVLFHLALSAYSYVNIDKIDSVFFKFDNLGVLLTFVLSILGLATFYHSHLYLKRHNTSAKHDAVYFSALIMFITAVTSAYFAQNIAILWACIEATSLFVSILIFQDRTNAALEATWKYLFISSIGLAIAFIGILFLSILANQNGVNSLTISNLLAVANKMNTVWLKLVFIFILTGFSVKISLFPFFAAAIDAKTIAASPVNAIMSTALVNVGFIAIFRVFTIISHTEIKQYAQHVLLITALVSIFIAIIQVSRIKRLKRLYAFSTMEHMGIVLLGMAVGGIGYYAAILHIVFHSFVKAGVFYQIGHIRKFYKSNWLNDTGNYFKISPIGGLVVILGMVSILAIPPSGLFISEFLTFKAMFIEKYYLEAIFALILLTVMIYFFVKYTFKLLFDKIPESSIINVSKRNDIETLPQFILFALVIYLGINPPVFFNDLINGAIALLN